METEHSIYCLASSSLYIAVGDRSGRLYLFDAKTDKLVKRIDGHQNGVSWISFSHDNSLMATGGFDNVLNVWQIDNKDMPLVTSINLGEWIGHIDFHWSNELMLVAHYREISIFSTKTWQQIHVISDFSEPLSACFAKEKSTIWIGGREGGIGKWNYENGKSLAYLKEPEGSVFNILVDEFVYIWDLSGVYKYNEKSNNLALLATPSTPNYSVGGGDIDFDKRILIFPVHEGEIGVFNLEQQKILTYIKTESHGVYRAVFSHDKKTILAGMQNGIVGKWRMVDFTQEAILNLG
jgi:WD40 repeat protein